MGEPLGEQNHPRLVYGGTYAPNVPPFCFGCQCYLLVAFRKIKVGLPMKKAANGMLLAAFKLASGGAGGI